MENNTSKLSESSFGLKQVDEDLKLYSRTEQWKPIHLAPLLAQFSEWFQGILNLTNSPAWFSQGDVTLNFLMRLWTFRPALSRRCGFDHTRPSLTHWLRGGGEAFNSERKVSNLDTSVLGSAFFRSNTWLTTYPNRGSLLSCLFFFFFLFLSPATNTRSRRVSKKGLAALTLRERLELPCPFPLLPPTGLRRRPLSALPPFGGVGERLRLAAK